VSLPHNSSTFQPEYDRDSFGNPNVDNREQISKLDTHDTLGAIFQRLFANPAIDYGSHFDKIIFEEETEHKRLEEIRSILDSFHQLQLLNDLSAHVSSSVLLLYFGLFVIIL